MGTLKLDRVHLTHAVQASITQELKMCSPPLAELAKTMGCIVDTETADMGRQMDQIAVQFLIDVGSIENEWEWALRAF